MGCQFEEEGFSASTSTRKLQESDIVNVEGGMYSDYKQSSGRKIDMGRKIESNLEDADIVSTHNKILSANKLHKDYDKYSEMKLNFDSVFSD